jgi:hypothetical protein
VKSSSAINAWFELNPVIAVVGRRMDPGTVHEVIWDPLREGVARSAVPVIVATDKAALIVRLHHRDGRVQDGVFRIRILFHCAASPFEVSF